MTSSVTRDAGAEQASEIHGNASFHASQSLRHQGRQDWWVSLDSSLSCDSDSSRLTPSYLGSLPAICWCSGGPVCSLIICCPRPLIFWPAALSSDLRQSVHGRAEDSNRSLWSLMVQAGCVCRSDWGTIVVWFYVGKRSRDALVCATLKDTGKRTIISPRFLSKRDHVTEFLHEVPVGFFSFSYLVLDKALIQNL